MLKIYEFITKMQRLIGNNAEVRLSARDEFFIIRVDWRDDDFRAQRQFDEVELSQIVDDGLMLDHFVNYCRNAYARKKAG